MAKIENVQVYGLEESIFRSGYPMRDRPPSQNDFLLGVAGVKAALVRGELTYPHVKRAITLANAKGGGHDQFLTGITVCFDLTCSNKAWVEAERYTFLNFISSMSSMHRASRFSIREMCNEYVDPVVIQRVEELQRQYNALDSSLYPQKKKAAYLHLLNNLPAGFEVTAAMTTNYRCLKNIYAQRKGHRLPDWHDFCNWVETLPLAKELLTGRDED